LAPFLDRSAGGKWGVGLGWLPIAQTTFCRQCEYLCIISMR